ncbi:MAG TPA: tetratricopeptide repeat protein [Candidatus Angelobacter sp.]|nr:tetratricopeptide repeat protein [Candidatus Angelobacter sp.]
MFFRISRYILVIVVMHAAICWGAVIYAQSAGPVATPTMDLANAMSLNTFDTATLDVHLKGPDGQSVKVAAVVTLIKLSNEAYRQETAKAGHIRFNNVAATEYSVQVVAPGYQTVVKHVEARKDEVRAVTIELQQMSVEDVAENTAYKALAPKAQKEIGKALELLRAQRVADARSHLDAANRVAPNQAEVQYLYGVYAKQTGNAEQAKAYWMKAVEFSPKHLLGLLSLADALLRENHENEALLYATRAVEVEPTSWRAHAILANVYLRLGLADDAIQQAERAIDQGHGEAAMAQPVLAAALARKGEKDRAISVLQSYLKDHPADAEANKLQEDLQRMSTAQGPAEANALTAEELSISTSAATSLPLPSSWLPPDVDEKVPPVEQGAACALEDVVQKAGKQAQVFVKNVERFTASEFLKHEAIDKWGMPGAPETRKFDYVVGIEELRPGILSVEEYRSSVSSAAEFPAGVETKGLPALMLIFHPLNAVNFEMKCEGLTRWNGRPAWQIHFRQRPDKPNTIKSYRLGMNGPSYLVALKGRAWILADNFQVARLETDLIAPVPQIKLVADHTVIEYGPVRFQNRNVEMWLPQSAEVYYDWRGHRSHRRHSFSKYMLFSVDEKQNISAPKTADAIPAKPEGDGQRPNP